MQPTHAFLQAKGTTTATQASIAVLLLQPTDAPLSATVHHSSPQQQHQHMNMA
jgi:hypothetical protein